MDDIDFKAKVTRVEFEELCSDLFERVPGPVQEALTAADMKLVSMSFAASFIYITLSCCYRHLVLSCRHQ